MNQKGFTVIELLVSLTVIGVLMSLLISSMITTRQYATNYETRADNLTEVVRTLDFVQSSLRGLNTREDFEFNRNSMKFVSMINGSQRQILMQQQGDAWSLSNGESSPFAFPGTIELQFLNGNSWVESMDGSKLPGAVAIACQHEDSGEVYEIVINILSGQMMEYKETKPEAEPAATGGEA